MKDNFKECNWMAFLLTIFYIKNHDYILWQCVASMKNKP